MCLSPDLTITTIVPSALHIWKPLSHDNHTMTDKEHFREVKERARKVNKSNWILRLNLDLALNLSLVLVINLNLNPDLILRKLLALASREYVCGVW